ncbi:MAG: hypothetical protein HOE90_01795 [Bacteriovoracaceae bacterium]|nr:hypothetical protein [Bacteriovoracaceae bacterium]
MNSVRTPLDSLVRWEEFFLNEYKNGISHGDVTLYADTHKYLVEEAIELGVTIELINQALSSAFKRYEKYKLEVGIDSLKEDFDKTIEESIWVRNIQKKSELVLVHYQKRRIARIDNSYLNEYISKLGDTSSTIKKKKEKPCVFSYNPFQKKIIDYQSDFPIFNQYVPPFWLEKYYWGEEDSIGEGDGLPLEITEYLTHLCSGERDCQEYVLHWMAKSLRSKNVTALLLLSETRGTGKTLLYELLSLVHGHSNAVKTRDYVLKKEFNRHLKNKSLVLIDEISINKEEHFNNLKDYTNPRIEITGKGVDSEQDSSFINLILASNNLNALPLHLDERQFAVIEVPETPMSTAKAEWADEDLIKKSILRIDNVERFARYLWHFKYDNRLLLKPYRGKKAVEVIAQCTPSWEKYLVDEWFVEFTGKEKLLNTLKEELEDQFNHKLSTSKLTLFLAKHPDKFEVGRFKSELQDTNKNKILVRINKKDKKSIDDIPF